MYGLKSLICELQQQARFPYTYKNKKPISLQFLANIPTHAFHTHKVTLRTHTQYPVTHLQSVSAWKRLNASTQLKLQVNTYANCLFLCTGYTSTDIMLHSCFILGASCTQFSFQRLVILTEVCGCYHIPSKKIAEESTDTSCCILSMSFIIV